VRSSKIRQCRLADRVQNRCDIRPRGPERVALIKSAWQEAQTRLDADGNFKEEFFQNMVSKKELQS